MAADRTAAHPGDSLTIVIVEMSSAAASAQSGSQRDTRLAGSIGAGGRVEESGNLGLQGEYEGRGQLNRSGRLVGQIGATVQAVLPNGDLRIAGSQTLQIDGERTSIRLTARVRRADISGDNTVLSSRLADAEIVYDGDGSLSRSGSPALLNRIMSFLGLS
ncbi:flagellar basal body L-ring protein FlgH [Brevundimonas sp.]|uniref:flagellar basal body L-ring protein FlgH n=1 Tax=Brevundimonas sp. TaxID=1871086 RepID=UPI002D779785|nr:flagellar basal body L-ring protein FlgH [Brevundimonas sp.]